MRSLIKEMDDKFAEYEQADTNYIEVAIRDAREALDIYANIARNYNDISLRGSNYYYSDNASELADLLATFDSHSIEIYDANINEDELDEQNVTGAVAGFNTPAAFAKPGKWKSKSIKYENVNTPPSFKWKETGHQQPEAAEETAQDKFPFSNDDAEWMMNSQEYPVKFTNSPYGTANIADNTKKVTSKVEEALEQKYMQLIEGYRSFATGDPNVSPERKVKSTIQEIAKKLHEIEKLVQYNSKLKTEAGIASSTYGPATAKALNKISERLIKISERVRSLGE
jgi:hypothetical protein